MHFNTLPLSRPTRHLRRPETRSALRVSVSFVVAVAFGSVATGCNGCGGPGVVVADGGGTDSGSFPDGGGEFDAGVEDGGARDAGALLSAWDGWRALVDGLEGSPDHLPGRAARLVEGGTPESLFLFVRDEIVTYPPSDNNFFGADVRRRWGTRGTLRGGAGTPREKADLLVDLLAQQNIEARVVRGQPRPDVTGELILHRAVVRTFAPSLSDDQWAAIETALGTEHDAGANFIDADSTEATALSASLLALIATNTSTPFDFSLGQLPLVAATIDGADVFMQPNVPGATFGDSMTVATPVNAGAADPLDTLTIRIEGARSDAPFDLFPIIEHTYAADDVVGRRIELAFSPPVGHAALATMEVDDVSLFVPSLAVLSPALGDDERESLHVVGNAISRGGDVFALDGAGNVLVNGVSIGHGATSPEDLASVDTATARANGIGFPTVRLHVGARDVLGARVHGLGIDAFTILDDGTPVAAVLRQNVAPAPRVLVLYDTSESIPAAYVGAGAVAVGEAIASDIYAAFPSAQFRVGVVNVGAEFASETWATNLTDANAQVAFIATQAWGSEIYSAIVDANGEGPTVIVLVTDGDATEVLNGEHIASMASGAPVFTVAVGTPDDVAIATISNLTGGESASVVEQANAVAAVVAYIESLADDDYEIQFQAPIDGATLRTVSVTIDDGRVSTTAAYEVPTTPVVTTRLSSLVLTIENGDKAYTRTLAGVSRASTTQFVEVTTEDVRSVEEMLFGRVVFSVEGAAPSLSLRLAEQTREKLRYESLFDAIATGDPLATTVVTSKGLNAPPWDLTLMQHEIPRASSVDALTFETDMRIVANVTRPRFGTGFAHQVDVWPLMSFRTTSSDAQTAFETTLARTAYIAIAEAALRQESTNSLLVGVPLSAVNSGAIDSFFSTLSSEERAEWRALAAPFGSTYTLVVPTSGSPRAFYAVQNSTGTVIGVLPDGSGGAREEVLATLEQTRNLLAHIRDAGGFVAVWSHIAEFEAELVARATILIATGEDIEVDNPFIEAGCDAAREGLIGSVPGGSYFGDVLEAFQRAGRATGLGPLPSLPLPGC